jgi:transcriptional regulator with XRE-family HTH domain
MNSKDAEKKDKLKLQKKFGEHLKKLRESIGLSPAELARRCFMERSNIARLEAGRTNPSLYVLKKLSEGMGLTMDEVFKAFK